MADTREHRFPGGVTGRVNAGRYVIEVGAPAGMKLVVAAPSQRSDARPLAQALERSQTESTPVAELSELVDDASDVTRRGERAVALFVALAEGRVDREALKLEIDELIGLLGRLDRKGRFAEALGLARATSDLFALALRWVALVQALHVALRAARSLVDSSAEAWALHQIGSLALAAGDPRAALELLGQARELREQLGDEVGLAVTEHNLNLAWECLRIGERGGQMRRRTLLVGGGTLLAGGAVGLAVALRDGGSTPTPTVPATPTPTPRPSTTPTPTATPSATPTPTLRTTPTPTPTATTTPTPTPTATTTPTPTPTATTTPTPTPTSTFGDG